MNTDTSGKKPYHFGNLKETLIEQGIELIHEEGIEKFSLRKVAKKWIAKTLHSGGVEGGGTKAGREAERCCTPCLPERSAVRRGVEGSRAVPTGSAAAAAARDPSTPRLAGLPALASRAREFDSLLACRMLRSLRTTAGVPPRGARRGRGGLACRRRCSSGTRCGCSP